MTKMVCVASPHLSSTKTLSYKSYLVYTSYVVPQYFIYLFYVVPQKCSSIKNY